MIKSFRLITIAFALFFAAAAHADYTDLPIKTIDGKQWHVYVVQPKETVYSLCKRFNITAEELIKYNPSVEEGLKAQQELKFPARGVAQPQTHPQSSAETYVVQKGDTGYGISRRFGLSLDEFYALNPDAQDGVKIGQTVVVSAKKKSEAPKAKPATPASPVATATEKLPLNKYKVQPRDTYYSIARAHGISVEQLMGANPEVDVLRADMVITLPESCAEPADQMTVAPATAQVTPSTNFAATDTITIAVALPFMLNQSERPRQAKLYAEFYKGLLLAVDSLGNIGRPIRVMAFDTEGSDAKVSTILADKTLSKASMIIAPDSPAQLKQFGDFGRDNGVNVINLYVVKDDSYLSNPRIMQANIPSANMVDKAISFIQDMSISRKPVILRNTAVADKADFLDKLKARLTAKNIEFEEIVFNRTLAPADFDKLSKDGEYLVIPSSSKQAEANAIFKALAQVEGSFKRSIPFRVFGYPEWVTFRGKTLENMHKYNTLVYSRFFADSEDSVVEQVEESFQTWYGTRIANRAPRQGLLGFDVGAFLINSLKNNGGDYGKSGTRFDGVQSCFNFVKSGSGWCNDALYIIQYNDNNLTKKIIR